ncbi:MAG: restriction endonuclease subunit S [Bacteroidales bacterium]|nr:restriction endonuclease subunit S [Bacteroidales bacterium]
MILELAVQGELVQQDYNDESANELLKQISKEKSRLIKEGKIKKQILLPEITESEKPFLLPKEWKWVRLGMIGIGSTGKTPSTNFQRFFDGNIPFVGPGQLLPTGEIADSDKTLTEEGALYSAVALEGDILMVCIGGSIGKSAIVKSTITYNQQLNSIHPLFMEPDYLYFAMNSPHFQRSIIEKATGSATPIINRSKWEELLIPLPPLSEQHRIVNKVDELIALCDKLEQQQTNSNEVHQTLVDTLLGSLTNADSPDAFDEAWQRIASYFDTLFTTEHSIDQLKQTILQLAVMGKLVPQNPDDEPASELLKKITKEKAKLVKEGKIKNQKPLPEIDENEKLLDLPANWGFSRLGTFTIVGTGSTPSRDKGQYYFPQEFNWVSSGETSQDFIYKTDEKISSLALKETNVSIYPIGSLIVAMYGQGKTRGQVSELMVEAGTNQACAAVVLINKEEAHRKYLKYFFKKAYEELRSHAAGGAQPNLNLGKVANTVIPIPPLAEQHRIVAKVDKLFALCDSLKERLRETQALQNQLAVAVVEQAV